jgi:hypothetical protein
LAALTHTPRGIEGSAHAREARANGQAAGNRARLRPHTAANVPPAQVWTNAGAGLHRRGRDLRYDARRGVSGLTGRPAAESSISVASRLALVSGFFALTTQYVAAVR